MPKTINITKEAGVVLYRDYIIQTLDNALNTCANGQYTLSLKKRVKKRTLDQNAYFWLLMTCIEKETGEDKYVIHDFYCSKFLRSTETIKGMDMNIVRGTSKLTTQQFNDFLDRVREHAKDFFGMTLPVPEDRYYESFQNEYEQYMI